MKKTILFTILAMGLQCAAAQSTGFYLNSSLPSLGKGIIRENNIVYYEDYISHYFAYIPSFLYTDPATTTNYKRVQLPENWVVMDFHVLDGIAYFCGVDMGDTSALLGHFVISELFHYPLQVHFHRDVNIAYKLKILHRIVVNTDKTTISMMAIGNTKMQNNLWEACSDVVLYIDDYGAASGCLFFGDDYDVFWDVVSTENYFVVVGTLGNVISGGVKDLTMRRIPFGTPWTGFLPPFEIRYSYDCVHTFAGGVRASAIDKDRLGVTGGSYGGYMTNWIIGQTDRFKAAATQRSISNWITEVGVSDYGIDFPIEQQFGDLYNCAITISMGWRYNPSRSLFDCSIICASILFS